MAGVSDERCSESVDLIFCCNCGIKVEQDAEEDVQLKFTSPIYEKDPLSPDFQSALLATYSTSVKDVVSKVFKTNFDVNRWHNSDTTVDDWQLCGICSVNLKDLFILWNAFLTRASSISPLYVFLIEEAENNKRKRKKSNLGKKLQQPSTVPVRRSNRKAKEAFIENDFYDEEAEYSAGEGTLDVADMRFKDAGNVEFTGEDLEHHDLCFRKKNKRTKRGKAVTKGEPVVVQLNGAELERQTATRLRMRRNRSVYAGHPVDEFLAQTGDVKEKNSDVSDDDKDEDFDPDGGFEEEEDSLVDKTRLQRRQIDRERFQLHREIEAKLPVSKPHVCLECHRRFHSKMGLNRHMGVAHRNRHGPFYCEMEGCKKLFSNYRDLEGHMNHHLGYNPFICDKCGWSTNAEVNLSSHMKNMHTSAAEKETLKTKICVVCGAKFITAHALKLHTYVHTDERPHSCPYEGCKSKFKIVSKLRLHVKEVHLDINEKHRCPRCSREFGRRHNLKLHMERHEKYDLLGMNMRKSKDPPVRKKYPVIANTILQPAISCITASLDNCNQHAKDPLVVDRELHPEPKISIPASLPNYDAHEVNAQ